MNIKRAFLAAIAVLMVPSLAMAQSTVTFSTLISSSLAGSPEMTITCNGGLPLTQSAAIGTTFTVTEIANGNVCNVDLTGDFDAGYELDFFACVPSGVVTDTGCEFTMAEGTTDWQTQVWVMESPFDFHVDVTWEISPEADPGVGMGTVLEISCLGETTTMTSYPAGPEATIPSPAVAGVLPGTTCSAALDGYGSAVDVDPSICVRDFTVDGGDQSCSFTATAFYEGIPTLSQYGMAIMALLMLGVGFVGFRRFV